MQNKLKSLENRLYQLIISRLDGDSIHSEEYQEKIFELVSKGIGGFIVFGGERDSLKGFIEKLQSVAEIPLFIASDIERGVGQHFRGCTIFPCQMAVRAAIHREREEDIAVLREAIRAIALEAIDVGINLSLIPVLDVNQIPDNPIICTRAFSDDSEDVSFFGSEYIKTLEESGLISCAKHFPGHGSTTIDSHISLPCISKSYQELIYTDIPPFKEAIRAGVGSIMVGHLHIPALDSLPASLSEKVVNNLLRQGLGFEGLIMTDALNMAALYGIDNVPARCVKAGVNLLLHPADSDMAVRELTSALKSNVINEECVDASIDRIIEVKERIGQTQRIDVDYCNNDILSKRITDMSITLVKYKAGILPITAESMVHVVFVGEDRFYKPSLWEGHFKKVSTIKRIQDGRHCEVAKGNRSNLQTLHGVGIFSLRSGCARNDREDGSSDEIIIFAIFSEVAPFRGRTDIDDEERKQIIELIRKSNKAIVISFGSPYILSNFKGADIHVAAYDAGDQTQEAVIRCLKGESDFRGQIPVKIQV